MTSLNGQVVLITGAARGIGAQTARVLADRGARVAAVGLEPHRLAELVSSLGPGHLWAEADVTEQASLDAAVATTCAQFGGIDAVIANAGVASFGTVRTGDPDAFVRTIEVNLVGAYRTVHAALPAVVRRRGYVLVVASVASFAPLPGMAAYSASKAGAEYLTAALRAEVAHLGVRVGSAHPSWVDTDLVRDAMHDLASFRQARARLPWPAHATISVEACAEAIATGVQRRSRRVFVPRSVALLSASRALMVSPLASAVMRRRSAALVPQMEREIAALGRPFGAHSVGSLAQPR